MPIILNKIDELGDSVPKSTIYRLKSLVNDLERNKHRIVTIFGRLENARDKEDEQNILKKLAAEELLSTEQYNRLSQLDEINPNSIAIIIKGTKIGQGLMHMPTNIDKLRKYSKVTDTPAFSRLKKLL